MFPLEMGQLICMQEMKNIITRSSRIKADNEKSSIMKPCHQAHLLLKEENFLNNIIYLYQIKTSNQMPINYNQMKALVRFISKKFNVQMSRAFQRYCETQLLSLALYYESWWPFIEHSNSLEDGGKIQLDIPDGMTFIDKNSQRVTLSQMRFIIPVKEGQKVQEIPISKPLIFPQVILKTTKSIDDELEKIFDHFDPSD